MDKNMEWFVRANLSPYEGKYVAIAKESVVASGEEPGDIYEEAQRKYPDEEVVLWKVPEGKIFVF